MATTIHLILIILTMPAKIAGLLFGLLIAHPFLYGLYTAERIFDHILRKSSL